MLSEENIDFYLMSMKVIINKWYFKDCGCRSLFYFVSILDKKHQFLSIPFHI